MRDSRVRYKSYILRFWQEDENTLWRARLESIGNQNGDKSEVKHFADAKLLLDLLNPTVSEKDGKSDSD